MSQSNLQRVNNAHERRDMFVQIHQRSSLAELKLLYDMFSNRDWLNLGFERWQDYVEAPIDSGGIGVSREWATQLVQVYKKYIIELGLDEQKLLEVSPRKLYQLKNVVNQDNVDDMLDKAKSLSLRDLTLEVSNVDTMECQHEDYEIFHKCKLCKSFKKI